MGLIVALGIAFVASVSFLIYKILEKQDREIEERYKPLRNFQKQCDSEKKVATQQIVLSNKQKEIVRENSKKIRDLITLNNSTQFHDVPTSFEIAKRYDNKSHYNKIDPAFLMAADIREHLADYAKYIEKVKENRERYKDYKAKVDELFKKEYPIDFDSLKMPLSRYYKCEESMFNEVKLKPVVDCEYRVRMSYSSPKGQVRLYKEDRFNLDDMFTCLESVSRSHLDRETYKKMAAVERGEVSDSLRYDIMNRDNFTCVLCGASARQGVRLHVDHIIPIAKGGKSTPDNLRTLCERCNVGKSDKTEGSPQTEKPEQDEQICKWCGSKLVLRQGKNGEFYGCSKYPKCRYTKSK